MILTDYYLVLQIKQTWEEKIIPLENLSIYYTWKNINKSYKNDKFKISAARNEEFELLGTSYSVSDIQDYFEYIFKKYGGKSS